MMSLRACVRACSHRWVYIEKHELASGGSSAPGLGAGFGIYCHPLSLITENLRGGGFVASTLKICPTGILDADAVGGIGIGKALGGGGEGAKKEKDQPRVAAMQWSPAERHRLVEVRTMRVELIGHFKPCVTEIYLHI